MLRGVRKSFRADEVERRLDRLREPLESPRHTTGIVERSASSGERGHEPLSVSAAGCTPCANSRSSRRPRRARPRALRAGHRRLRRRACRPRPEPRPVESPLRAAVEAPARAAGAASRPPRRCGGATPRARRRVPRLRLERGIRHRELRRCRHRSRSFRSARSASSWTSTAIWWPPIAIEVTSLPEPRQLDGRPASSTRAPVAGSR